MQYTQAWQYMYTHYSRATRETVTSEALLFDMFESLIHCSELLKEYHTVILVLNLFCGVYIESTDF